MGKKIRKPACRQGRTETSNIRTWCPRSLFILFTAFCLFLAAVPARALTLAESINVALRENPAVKASKSNLEASQARLSQAFGAFLPSINLTGNLGQSFTQPSTVQITSSTTAGAVTQTFTFGTNAPYDIMSYSTSLSQPLFVGALFPGYSMAAKSVDVASQDFRKTVQDTIYNVTVAYFGVLASQKYIELCQDSLKTAQTHHAQVATMLRNGVAPQADYLRAEVRVSNAEVALTKSYNTLETSKNAFNNALGVDLDAVVEIQGDYKIPSLEAPSVILLLDTAYSNRPDWLSFVLGKKIAEDNLFLAKTAYWPTFYLNGSSSYQDTRYPAYENKVGSWTVVGAAAWNIFDGFTRYNKEREAAAGLSAQVAKEAQVKNAVEMEVKDAYFNLKTALAVISTAQKTVTAARESERVSTLRYNSGVGTNLEVINAQESLTEARNDLLKSIYDLEVAKARVNKVIGYTLL